jgi:hypothetical protein
MSRRRRGNRNVHHHHRHYHDHRTLTVTQRPQSSPVSMLPSTNYNFVNAPSRITTRISNQTFAPTPTVTPMPTPPVVQQKSDDSFAAFITGVLSALVVAASLLGNHAGSPRRK